MAHGDANVDGRGRRSDGWCGDGGLVKVSWRRDNGKSEYSYSVPIGYEVIVEEEK